MLGLGFYGFKERLALKCGEFGARLHAGLDESYTSKTHSETGEIVKVGGAERITSQGITLDRDANGARNIWIKNVLALGEMAPGESPNQRAGETSLALVA